MSQRLARSLDLRVDLYNPKNEQTKISKRFQGSAPSSTPTVSAAPARILSSFDASKPNAPGRSNVDQMDTTDVLRIASTTPCGDGWYGIVVGPATYPELGTWFRVQGGPRSRNRGATKNYLIVRETQPAWIA